MVVPDKEAKFAVTVTGALMVTVVDALVTFATGPLQPVKVNPGFADAVIGIEILLSKNPPVAGETVPPLPGEATTPSWYCTLKVARKVAAVFVTVIV